MTISKGTAEELIDTLKRKSPAYLDLFTAETDEEFEAAFNTILEVAVSNLEKYKKKFAKLDEEALSGILAGNLTMPGLTVTPEAYSNGHVDMTIVADHCTPARVKLAEAKIYKGPKYHFSGLHQLLERYTTGREGRGLIISYIKKENIKQLTEKLREQMDKQLPQSQVGKSSNHVLKWSFLTTHSHSSGENLEVAHIGCNLYYKNND